MCMYSYLSQLQFSTVPLIVVDSDSLTLDLHSFLRSKFRTPKYEVKNVDSVVVVRTVRPDVVECVIKEFRSRRIVYKLIVHDKFSVLTGAYPTYENTSYVQVPSNKWDAKWDKRYKQMLNTNVESTPSVVYESESYNDFKVSSKTLEKTLSDGWIIPGNIKGGFHYLPKYLALEKALEHHYYNVVLQNVEFEKHRFLPFMSFEHLQKTDYFSTAGPNLFFICRVNKDVSQVQKKFHLQNYIDPDVLAPYLQKPVHFLNYCSCQGFFPSYEHHNFQSNTGVRYFYDNDVPTYRNEHGKTMSLQRLQVFTRNELIFVANTYDTVNNVVQTITNRYKKFFDSMKIPFRIVKVRPWFDELKTQDLSDVQPYTLDFETVKDASKNSYLEIGNISNNSNKWTRAYNVKIGHKPTYSGCAGIGKQRLAWVFLQHNGFDTREWNERVKKDYDYYLRRYGVYEADV